MKNQHTNKKTSKNYGQTLPTIENGPVNQTIIINNPNFNINYFEASLYNARPKHTKSQNKTIQEIPNHDIKKASKGVEDWKLNKNLKEFSDSKQLRFFKGNEIKGKSKSNVELQRSPYFSLKTKPQDSKLLNKINSTSYVEQPNSGIKIKLRYGTEIVREKSLRNPPIREIESEPKIAFRKKKFESKIRVHRHNYSDLTAAVLEQNLKETIELEETVPSNNGSKTERNLGEAIKLARKNKFMKVEAEKNNETHFKNLKEQEEESDLESSLLAVESEEGNERESKKARQNRAYEKSREKISSFFESKTNNYLEYRKNEIPKSQIEFYSAVSQHPSSLSHNKEYRSSALDCHEIGYDFRFEEEKSKNRARTPYKRKKVYEGI